MEAHWRNSATWLGAALRDWFCEPSEPTSTHLASAAGWAVRRDWPDGTHEFIGPERDQAAAAGLWSQQVDKWRRFPHRPRMSVVSISVHDFWLHAHHRRDCAAPDCPTAAEAVAA